MTRTLSLLLAAALVAPGCAGTVKFDEIDGFGLVASAEWVHVDAGELDYDYIVLSNVSGLCDKLQDFEEVAAEYQEALEDATKPDNMDDFCEDMEEPFADYADASGELYTADSHFLYLNLDDDGDSEPSEDTYEVDDNNKSLVGSITYVVDDLLGEQLDDYDPDEDLEDNCGIDPDDYDQEDYAELWIFSDGEVEFTAVEDEESAKGELDSELEEFDEDGRGDDAGNVSGSFTATYCEIDL